MYYEITCTTVDWVEANSKEEAQEKWLCENTIASAENEVKIEEDPDFY